MRLTANIVLASLLYLMPHVFMSTVSALPGNDVIELRFEHEHGEAVEHSHEDLPQSSHTHAQTTESVSHHSHPEPHWHSIQFLPALNRLFLKHNTVITTQSLWTFQAHDKISLPATPYQAKVWSPKQTLYLRSCVFIL